LPLTIITSFPVSANMHSKSPIAFYLHVKK
jgi:hypothetical protein